MYLWVWNLVLNIVLCQGEDKYLLLLDTDAQNTTYVLASKVTQAAYFVIEILTNIKVFKQFRQCMWKMSWF